MSHQERIRRVRAAIADAERRAGRSVGSVRLLAVSKTRSADDVRAACAAGLSDFGENYAQEGVAKVRALKVPDVTWHFIGRIQSNKTRDIARHFHWAHGLDRARVATRLNDAAARPLNVCVQVNVDAAAGRSGVAPDELTPLLEHVRALPRLRLRGLMAMPAPDADQEAAFRRLKTLFDRAAPDAGPHWDTLSMGMSGDFPTAIAQGSTIVRVGTAIFGPRATAPPAVAGEARDG